MMLELPYVQDCSTKGVAEIRRALIIRRGGLGDIILATPMMRALAQRYHGLRMDVLVQKGAADAASGLPYIDRVFEMDGSSNAMLARMHKLVRLVRRNRYDLVVNLQPGLKTRIVAEFSGAKTLLTFQKDRRVQAETGRVRHAVDDFIKTLAPLGIETVTDRSLDFFVPDAARERVAELLGERKSATGRRLIVLNPTATRVVNRWPEQNWAMLIDYFAAQPGTCVAVIGAGRDLPTVREVQSMSREWGHVLDLSNRITLKELGALLEQASVFVTGDTGPMHIGAAVGAPVICLSGAADPDRTGPLTSNSTIIIDRSLPCAPCQDKHCRYGELPKCMELISVDQVIQACRRSLSAPAILPLVVAS